VTTPHWHTPTDTHRVSMHTKPWQFTT